VTNTRTVWLQADLGDGQGRLQAGMFANVRVLLPNDAPVLVVPETAITYASYGQTVFVAQEGEGQTLRVQRVAVKSGQRWMDENQALVEIISGLSEGQQVVVSGQLKLSDGIKVVPVESDALAQPTAGGVP